MSSRRLTGIWEVIAKCLVICALGAILTARAESGSIQSALELQAHLQQEALWRAAKAGDASKIAKLIEEGVHVDCCNSEDNNNTALLYAVRGGHVDALKTLLAHGAKADQRMQGNTALMLAIMPHGVPSAPGAAAGCVSVLLAAGADLNANCPQGTPFTMAARGQPFLLSAILATHPNVNTLDSKGMSPLMAAAGSVFAANVKALLDAGADVNLENRYGDTALTALMRSERRRFQIENEALLREAGALKQQPTVRRCLHVYEGLLPARLWALAATAMIQEYALLPDVAVDLNGCDALKPLDAFVENRKRNLACRWLINDSASLIAWLNNCERSGDRLELRKKPRIASPPQSDVESTKKAKDVLVRHPIIVKPQKPDPFASAFRPKMPTPEPGTKENNKYLAWDLCNFISVAREGSQAGYISADDAWKRIMPVAARLQRAFTSWEEMGKDYQDGWEQKYGKANDRYGNVCQMLLNPEDQNSPWIIFPWARPLDSSNTKQ